MLFNEPKLLKFAAGSVRDRQRSRVSVLFNEPKLLKYSVELGALGRVLSFSALQRAEIAEIASERRIPSRSTVSVLFNEPKLLKSKTASVFGSVRTAGFSALQRAEIAEIGAGVSAARGRSVFQCSSTSRNC